MNHFTISTKHSKTHPIWLAMALFSLWAPIAQIMIGIPAYATDAFPDLSELIKVVVGIVLILGIGTYLTGETGIFGGIGIALLMIFIPFSLGLFHILSDSNGYYWKFFLAHLVGSLMVVVTISSSQGIYVRDYAVFSRHFDIVASVTPIIVGVYLLEFAAKAISESLYFGPSTGAVLLVFPWLLAKRKWKLAALSIVLVAFGGKRAVIVALLIEIILAMGLMSRFKIRRLLGLITSQRFILVSIATVAIIKIISINSDFVSTLFDVGAERILWSIDQFGVESSNVSGGRFREIGLSFDEFLENPMNLVFGAGFGWSFLLDDEALHYVHLSPLNLLYQYGAIIFSIVIAALMIYSTRIFKYVRSIRDIQLTALFITFVGCLVEGLFSFMYVVNPIMWIIFGILLSRTAASGR